MVELRVPPEMEYGSLVAMVAGDAAARADLEPERRSQLEQAAKTGFECIVRDAMAGQRQAITVRADATPAEFRLSLFERGLPLDDAAVARDPCWAGVLAGVDSAHWSLHGRAGSELQLTIVRPHGTADERPSPAPQDEVQPAPEQTYTVRRFQPEDAAGVARAFYETWGYQYIFPAVYVPKRLIQLNASNAYISIVAVAESGEIVGHYALDPLPDAPIADLCAAIVVPAHRGRGLLERMRHAAEDEAKRLGFEAYYSEPVTTHGRTQQESAKFGAQLCAIVLGGDPKTFVPKAMDVTGSGQRQSFTVYFKPLTAREPRVIYAPRQHRAIVETIYANLGLPVDVREGGAPAGESRLRVRVVRGEGYASIDVQEAGIETAGQFAQAVRDLRALARLGAIYVNLPLESPGTPGLCEAAETLGFFFCGVVPWSLDGKDALRLQLPLTPIDLEQVTIAGDFGRLLKTYIATQMQARLS
ncbi:MAG TPA: GNAT family N-acetyltransferase [Candidatus Baltobacteraceae bacterium]|nr:GNAT family N-acetyltransferase [Candidatus Baltobacteraceae bacterium]